MVKAIIFDADHTLYTPKTGEAYQEQFDYLADNLGIDRERIKSIWQEEVDDVLGSDDPEERKRHVALERALLEIGMPVKEREDLVEEAVKRFWDQAVKDLDYSAYIPELIGRLLQRDLEFIAVASDEFREPLERKLNRVFGDWRSYFDFLVTPEDTGSMKPSKDFYLPVLKEKEIDPSEVVMIGDSWERDLKPAEEIGMKTVLVSEEKEGNPDFHIEHIKELEDIIDKI